VFVTHGYREQLARWLTEHGVDAHAVASGWKGEFDEGDAEEDSADPGTGNPEHAAGSASEGSA
jgi:hypothetical protein